MTMALTLTMKTPKKNVLKEFNHKHNSILDNMFCIILI